MATAATLTPLPRSSSTAVARHVGIDADGRGRGASGNSGSGSIALRDRLRTLPAVSAPSRVVRSTIEMARSMAASFDAFLIDRVARPAARCSTPTGSTPGSPNRNRRSEVSSAVASSRWAGQPERSARLSRGHR